MPRPTLVLAASVTEANAYAKAVGLQRREYRAVVRRAQIKGVRRADVHLLSSFLSSPTRHGIMAEMRLARDLDVAYVDLEQAFPEVAYMRTRRRYAEVTEALLDEAYAEHFERDSAALVERLDLTPEGPTLRQLEVAYRYNAMRDQAAGAVEGAADDVDLEPLPATVTEPADDEPDPEPVRVHDPAPEEAKRTRRTRCKDCGELFLASDPEQAARHEHKAPVVQPDTSHFDPALVPAPPAPTLDTFFS